MRRRRTYIISGIIAGALLGGALILSYPQGVVHPSLILFGAIIGGAIGEELYREKLRRVKIEKILRERELEQQKSRGGAKK
jgi:uncharacterized protein YcfJ